MVGRRASKVYVFLKKYHPAWLASTGWGKVGGMGIFPTVVGRIKR